MVKLTKGKTIAKVLQEAFKESMSPTIKCPQCGREVLRWQEFTFSYGGGVCYKCQVEIKKELKEALEDAYYTEKFMAEGQ
jgi:hypothetical protein